MASNYPPAHQAIPPAISYNDGLIPNDNPHTLYPEVHAKHDPVYHPPPVVPAQMPPAYPHELAGYESGIPEKRSRPFWKKPVTWVSIVALVVIAILAGLLGAVATGSIKTLGNTTVPQDAAVSTSADTNSFSPELSSPTSPAPSEIFTGTTATTTTTTLTPTVTTPTPSVPAKTIDSPIGPVTIECPGVDGLNLDVSSPTRGELTFRRLCNVNYPHGDENPGFGLIKDKKIGSLTECIKVCADKEGCVGVAFNDVPQCWLKHSLGTRQRDDGTEVAIVVRR